MTPVGLRVAITTDSVGGVWRYATGVADELVSRGAEVTLVGSGPGPSRPKAEEARRAGLGLAWLDAELDWTVDGRDSLARSAAALDRQLARLRPDILHLNSPALGGFLDSAAPRLTAVHSCIASWFAAVRGTAPPPEWQWHAEAVAAGLEAATVAVAPSGAFAEALRRCYGPLPRLSVVHNGGTPRPPADKAEFVLTAGRWWDEAKNLAALEAAAGEIGWPVMAAGPDRAPDGTTAAPEAVRWLGDLPASEFDHWVDRAAIFVSPALYEPFGLAVLEAAQAGAALVLSEIASFRELWGGAALFVEPRDAAGLARAVNRLIEEPSLRDRLAARARERARALTLARQVDGLVDAYARAFAAGSMAA